MVQAVASHRSVSPPPSYEKIDCKHLVFDKIKDEISDVDFNIIDGGFKSYLFDKYCLLTSWSHDITPIQLVAMKNKDPNK